MELPLHSVIGFSGRQDALLLTPDGQEILYPLGSAVVRRSKNDVGMAQFLTGATNHEVTCLALSASGRYLASGQIAPIGFDAAVLLRDLSTGQVRELRQHKAKVQALAFSADERYLATLGGEDDGSLVLWDVVTGVPLCGAPAHSNFAYALRFLHGGAPGAPYRLATGGSQHLRVWAFDPPARKLHPTDVALGAVTRNITTLAVDPADRLLYAGTTSGDVVQVNLERCTLRNSGPAKGPLHRGVTAMHLLAGEGRLVLGGGDGSVAVLAVDSNLGADPKSLKKFATVACEEVSQHPLTSIVLEGSGGVSAASRSYSFLVSTAGSELFRVRYSAHDGVITSELLQTAHSGRINDVALPDGYSAVFATAGKGAVRVWHLQSCRELLRIEVANLECKCVAFARDGKSILSGWEDGSIRAFGPQSGKLLYTIHDAHQQGVTALTGSTDSTRIISGGGDGTVRVWHIRRDSQVLEASMKEQRGAVTCITLRADGSQVATASADGSTILWDLTTHRRANQLLDRTVFKAVCYHPGGTELVTAGNDKRITYWDALSCENLRSLEASPTDGINTLALDPAGKLIISGGGDKLVRVWGFDDGRLHAVGQGHSAVVTRLVITPDSRHIISVGAEGAIIVYDLASAAAKA